MTLILEMKELDNLTPIRDIFENFVYKCQENYQIGKYSTVDERLESFRGCKFRQYIGNKSAKYCIKIYALVDSRFFLHLLHGDSRKTAGWVFHVFSIS